MTHSNRKPRVVIIGGGFGGLAVAMNLRKADVEVVLIDRHNYHLFQPLLYQVATAGLSPADIAAPIRAVLHRNKNTRVLLGEVERIDREKRRVYLEDGEVDYDFLVLAAGMQNNFFGNDTWNEHAIGLKSVDEALDIRKTMLMSFEAAEYETDPVELQKLLTFVVVGGGPTGVEMAGAISEIAREVMASDFRNIRTDSTRIILIEGQERLLGAFSEASSQSAREQLESRGVEIMLDTFVEDITEDGVTAKGELIFSHNIIWAAGMKAEGIADSLDAEQDRAGRVVIDADLTLPGDPRVYAIGDIAHFDHDDHGTLPGLAPVASQQGKHVAKNIKAHIAGKEREPFSYLDKGIMATIGRAAAVAEVGNFRMKGFIAWLAWLFIHLLFLVGFRNKVSVLINWTYSYIAFRRSTRLIVGAKADGFGKKLLMEGTPAQLEAVEQKQLDVDSTMEHAVANPSRA